MKFQILLVAVILLAFSSPSKMENTIVVKVNQPIAEVQPTMWGVFFEDINMGADGGIYAELVKNRSFEFYKPMMGWKVEQRKFNEGSVLVVNRQGTNPANPRFIRVTAKQAAKGDLGLHNEGFRGMGIKKDLRYDFSMMYRLPSGNIRLHIELVNAKNEVIGSASLSPRQCTGWEKQDVNFMAAAVEPKATLQLWFEGDGAIDLDMISLFPTDTWKNRPGGMRADMIQLLADMKPGFIRFPGGCIVEGHDLSVRYQWKKTIGPIEERQTIVNRWNTEFAHRPTPDYYQTFGLGFFEYFQLAEDIGAEPLPILNCGMACQFNTAEVVPMDQLQPYIQDALDLIEFANGDKNSTWGKVRASMGHPEPFNMKMLGIGNENWGPQYIERVKAFQQAIKEKYPYIKLVTSSGTDPDGERFSYLDGKLRALKADVIDEHYYRRPDWFLKNASRYDNYDRNGSKVFAGEYAAQSDKTVSIHNKNNLQTAIAEAAFLTGLERNADVVVMASYAPLFAHTDGWQWTPDLIWVDNLRAYGTANYHVQKLYSLHKGTHVVPALMDGKPVTGQNELYSSAVIDKKTKEVIVKIVNSSAASKETAIVIEGVKGLASQGNIITLTGVSPEQVNSLDAPFAVQPVSQHLAIKGKTINLGLPANSFTVVRIGMK